MSRLAIADPPYPPYADLSAAGQSRTRSRATRWYANGDTFSKRAYVADHHDDAAAWDRPETHRALLEKLHAEYDGWAIATSSDGAGYYGELPRGARAMVWVNPRSMPGGNRIMAMYELVLIFVPITRRSRHSGPHVPDVLTALPENKGFTGSKPQAWTQWVLEALGYDSSTDTVDDLFPGSGAVTKAVQGFQPLLVDAVPVVYRSSE